MKNSPLKILVIDDELSIRQFLFQALKPHKVILVESGFAALELLKSDPEFDLIILDYLMVGLDGLATLKRIKSNPDTKEIPVMIASGLTDSADVQEALNAGAVAYLHKPLDLQDIHYQISKIFSME